MLINYLRTALRRLWKNKGFFALNFVGLYVSVTACLLIALLIMYESSFDRGAPGGSGASGGMQVYRVVNQNKNDHHQAYNAVTPYPLAATLRVAMPDNHNISQIHLERDNSVLIGTQILKEKYIIFADSVFPRLFPVTVKEGSLTRCLSGPGFVALTQSTAKRYFGNSDPIGQRIKIGGLIDLEVAAVIADAPPNTHLPYHMLVSYPSLTKEFIGGFPLDQWTLNDNGFVYVGLDHASEVASTERTLADIVAKNIKPVDPTSDNHLSLQPLRAIHYDTHYADSNPTYTINRSYLTLIGAIGLFLILAACINYTNLSTAMALKKGKEVGVRKTLGATRGELMRQLLGETFVLSAIVIAAAAATTGLFLPILNGFLDKTIPTDWINLQSVGFLLALWAFVSLVSGIYPALVLSRFRPVAALKSMASTPKASVLLLRRSLVAFQFVTAQILIICAIVVSKQMAFIRSTPLGFNKDLVVDVSLPDNKPDNIRAFRSRLQSIPGIAKFSIDLGAPVTDNRVGTGFNRSEDFGRQQVQAAIKAVDKDYLDVYGLQLLAGRWIGASDEQEAGKSGPDSLKHYVVVLNEAGVKAVGYRSPEAALGERVRIGINQITAQVVGVVKDYHITSLHDPVMPILMFSFPFFNYNAGIKLSGGYSSATMAAIAKAYTEVYPRQLYEAKFLDEDVAAQYKNEERTQQLFSLFTGLSIAINVLGLVGLLAFMIEQKTKEVGIRKVLGAGIGDISFLFSREFLRLIGIAFLVAAPVAGLLMDHWLRDFAFRTTLSWWVFGATLLVTVVVTCIAISFQTLRAALVNPVKSLRSE